MTDQPRTPFLGTYILVWIGSAVAIGLLTGILATATGIDLRNGGMAVLPPLFAAVFAGRRWGQSLGAVPDGRAAWRFAAVAAVAAFAIQILLLLLLLAGTGSVGGSELGIIIGVMLFITLVTLLINRWFVIVGARDGARRAG